MAKRKKNYVGLHPGFKSVIYYKYSNYKVNWKRKQLTVKNLTLEEYLKPTIIDNKALFRVQYLK